MKKVLFVLVLAVIAFVGCKKEEQAMTAPETTVPAVAPAVSTSTTTAVPSADNAAAPAAPATDAGK